MIQQKKVRSITTKFFISGHSFMGPDQISSSLNGAMNKKPKIQTPQEAIDIMAKSRKKLHSYRMAQSEWKDWKKFFAQNAKLLGKQRILV